MSFFFSFLKLWLIGDVMLDCDLVSGFCSLQGLSKGSSFGEVSVDFAGYADATKLSSVSLPIKNSHSDAVLHVSI